MFRVTVQVGLQDWGVKGTFVREVMLKLTLKNWKAWDGVGVMLRVVEVELALMVSAMLLEVLVAKDVSPL